MPHDATKFQMGTTNSNVREVSSIAGDSATFRAGLCLHLNSSGAPSLAASDGAKIGISLGKDLADGGRVAYCRKGLGVPILLSNGFTPTKGAQVQISTTTGKAVSSGTAVNAVYASGTLTAVKEDGTSEADGCALIDMPGGL